MLRPTALLAALMLCGCVTTRTLTPADYVSLQRPPLTTSWSLTKLSVMPPTNPALATHEFSAELQQLENHVRDALTHEPALGVHKPELRTADYAVEVDVELVEGSAPNGWYGAGLGAAVGMPWAGAIAGALLASPTGPGVIVGAVVGGAVALGSTLAMPMETFRGQLVANIVIRRGADGTAIASRTARVDWTANTNAIDEQDRLANAAGAVMPTLERSIAEQVAQVFEALPPPTVLTDARVQDTQFAPAD